MSVFDNVKEVFGKNITAKSISYVMAEYGEIPESLVFRRETWIYKPFEEIKEEIDAFHPLIISELADLYSGYFDKGMLKERELEAFEYMIDKSKEIGKEILISVDHLDIPIDLNKEINRLQVAMTKRELLEMAAEMDIGEIVELKTKVLGKGKSQKQIYDSELNKEQIARRIVLGIDKVPFNQIEEYRKLTEMERKEETRRPLKPIPEYLEKYYKPEWKEEYIAASKSLLSLSLDDFLKIYEIYSIKEDRGELSTNEVRLFYEMEKLLRRLQSLAMEAEEEEEEEEKAPTIMPPPTKPIETGFNLFKSKVDTLRKTIEDIGDVLSKKEYNEYRRILDNKSPTDADKARFAELSEYILGGLPEKKLDELVATGAADNLARSIDQYGKHEIA